MAIEAKTQAWGRPATLIVRLVHAGGTALVVNVGSTRHSVDRARTAASAPLLPSVRKDTTWWRSAPIKGRFPRCHSW